MGAFRLRSALLLVTLAGCAPVTHRSAGSVSTSAPALTVLPAAPKPIEPSQASSPFHLVAEVPYAVALQPLASNALLIAGALQGAPLLIEDGALQFRPELSRLDSPSDASIYFISASAGSWPDNAWIALSSSSDAGPSAAEVYRWSSARALWEKLLQYPRWIFGLAPWREGVLLRGSLRAIGALVPDEVAYLSRAGLRDLKPAALCQAWANPGLAATWLHDGAVSVFGYNCGDRLNRPLDELMIETWSENGSKTQSAQRLPIDASIEAVAADAKGLAVMLPEHVGTGKPRRLARFDSGQWATLAAVPKDFTVLDAPGSAELWGLSAGRLQHWDGASWSSLTLPSNPSVEEWQAVWQRAANDVWLVGCAGKYGEPSFRCSVWNTAAGKLVGKLPTTEELQAITQAMTQEPEGCPHPFANFLALGPFEPAAESQTSITVQQAKRLLHRGLQGDPGFRKLRLVRHGCFQEDCIGAVVENREQAEALRGLLNAGKYGRTDNHCLPPPITRPFPVP
ncbi:MAG: hypothetical protein ABJB12_22640 [Pseudomonadota bacterium]